MRNKLFLRFLATLCIVATLFSSGASLALATGSENAVTPIEGIQTAPIVSIADAGIVEDTTGDDTVVEDTTGDDTVVEDTTGDNTVVEDTTGDDTVVEDTTGDDVVVEDTTGDDTVVEDTTGDDTVVEDTTGDDTVVEDTTGDDTVVEDTTGDDTVVEDTIGDDTVVEEVTEEISYDSNSVNVNSGWTDINGKRYYYDEDGTMVIGLQQIEENIYYFDENGVMQTGWQNLKDGEKTNRYYFDLESGAAKTGLQKISGEHYYFKEVTDDDTTDVGVMQKGLVTAPDGKVYYLDETTGIAEYGWHSFPNDEGGEDTYFFGATKIHALTGVWKLSNKLYFFEENGILQTGNGFYRSNAGDTYCLTSTGSLKTGWISDTDDDGSIIWYYFDKTTGKMLTGAHKIGSYHYYLSEEEDSLGMMQHSGWQTVGDDLYYLDEANGRAKTGWFSVTDDDGSIIWYYFDKSTAKMLTGVHKIGSYYYYFCEDADSLGVMMQTGWQSVGDDLYYLDEANGRAKTGWFSVTDENGNIIWYYFDKATAKVLTGAHKIGSYYYYLSEEADTLGMMLTGWQSVGDNVYFFDESNGRAKTGWVSVTDDDGNIIWYYLNPSTGKILTGLQKIGSKYYYLSEEEDTLGIMQTGWKTIDGNVYFFDESNGAAKTGWISVTDDNSNVIWYYFSSSTGKMLTGLQKIGSKYYYLSEEEDTLGIMQEGFVTAPDGKNYFLNPITGAAYTGWKTIDGNRYYFGATKIHALTGAWTLSNKMYLFDENGVLLVGDDFYKAFDGSIYCLTPSGVLKTGWVSVTDGNGDIIWYYFSSSTGKMLTGLQKIGSKYYYLSEEEDTLGIMQHSGWYTDQKTGIICYLNADGTAKTGWLNGEDGSRYYLNPTKGGLATGLTKIGSDYYFFDETTYAMKTGFITALDGKKYYLNEDGTAHTGWKTIDGNRYYFGATRIYALTGVWTLSGNMYFFEEDGILQTGDGFYDSSAGDIYNLTPSGALKTGWFSTTDENGDVIWYYFSTRTGKMLTGLINLSGKYYVLDENGIMQHSGLYKAADGNLYYLSSSGAAKTGWHTIDGNKYFFGETKIHALSGLWKLSGRYYYFGEEEDNWGVMQTNCFYENGTKTYYFTSSGKSASGWVTFPEGKRYFCTKNFAMYTGWHTIPVSTYKDYSYYFYDDGIMATSTTIDGYTIDANGRTTITNPYTRMILSVQNYSSPTGYLCAIDTVNCKVGVFTGSYGNWELLYYWDCNVGAYSTPTPTGTFSVHGYYSYWGTEVYYCYYGTAFYTITGQSIYLFHSMLYDPDTNQLQDGRLGLHCSNGCVRLAMANCRWIYNNIPYGTTVVSY